MAHSVRLESLFEEVKFHKPGRDIANKAELKIEQLLGVMKEREARIAALCLEHHLSASDLFALAQAQSTDHDYRRGSAYVAPIRDVPAGVATALAKESQQLESERTQVRTLGLVIRNIDPTKQHELSFAELEYLAF